MSETEAPKLVIREHVEKHKPSIYDANVKQLADAGPGKDGVVVIPTKDLAKHKRELQRAATAIGRSSRVIESNDQGDGSTELVFQLRDKVTRQRKTADAPTDDSAVPEVTDAAEEKAPAAA